jgi:hypothetical protein
METMASCKKQKLVFETKMRLESRVARFFFVQRTKKWKIYQNVGKYTKWPVNACTKWPENLLYGHKIYHHLPLKYPPKFTQIGTFGLKMYHLATLAAGRPCPKLTYFQLLLVKIRCRTKSAECPSQKFAFKAARPDWAIFRRLGDVFFLSWAQFLVQKLA